MDRKYREYYKVRFQWQCDGYRLIMIKCISDRIKFHYHKDSSDVVVSVPREYCDALEFELNKAKRNDGYCIWYRI